MAAVEAAVLQLHSDLGFPGAERLYNAARKKSIGDELSAKDLRAIARRISANESSKQVLADPPTYKEGKVASRAIDDRWAADLISFVQRPHENASGVYQYVLIVQDIFSRFIWTHPIGGTDQIVAEFDQFLDDVGRTPRQLVTDKDPVFRAH